VGYQKAADLLLRGDSFSASEAMAMGFISEVIESGKVWQRAMEYATELSSKPRSGLIEVKRLLKRNNETIQQRADIELESFVQCLNTPAAREAMTAFLEKRKANFSNL
jgi:enoyl-CoA hydratase/carnithine racemase